MFLTVTSVIITTDVVWMSLVSRSRCPSGNPGGCLARRKASFLQSENSGNLHPDGKPFDWEPESSADPVVVLGGGGRRLGAIDLDRTRGAVACRGG